VLSDHEWKAVVQELSLLKEEVDRLREEMGDMKLHFKQVIECFFDGRRTRVLLISFIFP
jgi:hypothetical protein